MTDPAIKLFPADKNYILKEAQAKLKVELLEMASYRIVEAYRSIHNPLGLIDNLDKSLENYSYKWNPVLESLYHTMAGYYRFKNAENQLELLFDGVSHSKKFSNSWKRSFLKWIHNFCMNPNFHKTLLGATVFYPGPKGVELLESRLNSYLSKYFHLKIYKYRGIREFSAA